VKRCDNCGAPLPGNEIGCLYCGAGAPVTSIPELASAIAAGDSTLRSLLPRLATQLTKAMPDAIEVEHRGHFGKAAQEIKVLRAQIGDETFIVEDNGHSLKTLVNQEHAGVVMHHEQVSPKHWGERITQALQRYKESYT
jgi:hypothetical protein